ncbi:MAG: phage portal protein, partial [Sedimentisphaerales bacterium]|nr:phage portal protein [Sedimentisphaerales bacterium]
MNIKQQIGAVLVKGVVKTFGLSEYARLFLTGADLDDSDKAKSTQPYRQVSLVFTCIDKLINSVLGLPLVLSTVDEKIIESGPAYELLFNNPNLRWNEFVLQSIGNYALYRDVFWIMLDDPPQEILIVPGRQMRAITSDGTEGGVLRNWEFHGLNGEIANYSPAEVHHWKNFNPYRRFKGLGPIQAAEQNINYTFAAELLNASALANGAELGVLLSIPGQPGDDQIRMLREQFDSRQAGPAKARRTAVITGGAKVENAASSMADLEVAKLTEMSDKKICSAFGVPPGVAGLITDAQYSHGPAMRDFIFNTVLPLVSLFAGEITNGILNRFSGSKWLGGGFNGLELKQAKFYGGRRNLPLPANKFFRNARSRAVVTQNKAFAWFDSNQHPVVQEVTRETSEKLIALAKYVPVNDIVEANDLPYPLTLAGKYVWKNMGEVPADYILEAGIEGITGPSLPEGEPTGEEPAPGKAIDDTVDDTIDNAVDKTIDDPRKLRIWRNWVTSWAGIEREYHNTLRIFFVRQQRILIAKLKQVFAESKSASNESRATSDELIARIVFDLKTEDGKLRVINQTFFQKASELGIRQVFSEVLGLSGTQLSDKVAAAKLTPYLRGKLIVSTQKITGVNKVTQQLVANQLKTGLDAGEGLNDLTNRVRDVLGGNR